MDAVRSLLLGTLTLGAIMPSIATAEPALIQLQAGFMPDPHTARVVVGGDDPASELASHCTGFINGQQPTAIIAYQALAEPSQLGIFTAAALDTTLIVKAPDGSVHCNDDSIHLGSGAAGLSIAPAMDGRYEVWVGRHTADGLDSDNEATLAITEYGAAMWLTLNLEAGHNSLLLHMVNNDIDFGDDSGEWANDGECDDPRFIGPGMSMMPPFDHERRDASDCRVLFGLGEVRLGRSSH